MTMDDEDRAQPWWLLHHHLVVLMAYLEDYDVYGKADMLAAMEKPWKYTPEFERACKQEEEVQR